MNHFHHRIAVIKRLAVDVFDSIAEMAAANPAIDEARSRSVHSNPPPESPIATWNIVDGKPSEDGISATDHHGRTIAVMDKSDPLVIGRAHFGFPYDAFSVAGIQNDVPTMALISPGPYIDDFQVAGRIISGLQRKMVAASIGGHYARGGRHRIRTGRIRIVMAFP